MHKIYRIWFACFFYRKSKAQNLKRGGIVALGLMFVMYGVAQAQRTPKVAKIGQLITRPASGSPGGSETLRKMLRDLGYIEGKNIVFEYRYADGKFERIPILADELVRLNVDVLVTSSPYETLAAKKVTRTIPIVFYAAGDPVASGLVGSLARPGGNITGFTTISSELSGKRLELLKEILPNLSRVAVLWHRSPQPWKENQMAAQKLGLQLHSMEVLRVDHLETAFKEATRVGSGAVAVAQSPLASSSNRKVLTDLPAKYRLPTIYARGDFAEYGGLMSYGADRNEPYYRIASMVDKILKGTKPADIPVEQPTKFELVINLKNSEADWSHNTAQCAGKSR